MVTHTMSDQIAENDDFDRLSRSKKYEDDWKFLGKITGK